MKHRPWWLPGEQKHPDQYPDEISHVTVIPPSDLDEVILIRDGKTVRAVYRRHLRDQS